MSASSRMAQDADDATSESSWTALAKEKERDWSLDLEGEMDKLEVVGPGPKADPWIPKGRWDTNQLGQKLQKKKVKSRKRLKRKMIRVGSEETQDYVRETLAISHEEAEEMGFVPSA